MRSVTYSMGVSLDGYIAGPDGGFGWTAPDEEVFRLATDEVREAGVHLLGRRLYETMLYWETADQNPGLGFSTREFAAVWRALPKVVFSTTLSEVQRNARLAPGTSPGAASISSSSRPARSLRGSSTTRYRVARQAPRSVRDFTDTP